MKSYEKLDILIVINLGNDWMTCDSVVEAILEQHQKYGFTRFAIACPEIGWRRAGYIPKKNYLAMAETFVEIKKCLEPYDVECGWWVATTVKSGHSPEFTSVIKADGEEHPFANCCLDENFRKRLAEDIAEFARLTEPAFIVTEDDFALYAANGCYCKHHLDAFAKKMGRYYSREELVDIFAKGELKDLDIIRSWRENIKDSLVGLAKRIRQEVDKTNPEIPIGYNQPGGIDKDGADTIYEMAKALAGDKHVPFSRLSGASYNGINSKLIPEMLYHCLYIKQHIPQPFRCYHESDTFPHTRYFTSGSHMRTVMGTVYSYAFDGSLFYPMQILDNPCEEAAYSKMFNEERTRFNEVNRIAKMCSLKGVGICYDPFYNTTHIGMSTKEPVWVRAISRFGIPYTTLDSNVSFWDERQVLIADHAEIMDKLSKGLFLDGHAARALCSRGYGKYIGVDMGEDLAKNTDINIDLGAREVICDKFSYISKGKNMTNPYMLAPSGNGQFLEMTVTDEKCEVITELYTFQKEFVSPAMTRFENELGGKVVVMGITLDHNNSQSLFNYRRLHLLQHMLTWCCDDYTLIKNAPDVFVVMNEANNAKECGFYGMLTISNLCPDTLSETEIQMPAKWRDKDLYILDINGEWKTAKTAKNDLTVTVKHPLNYLEPMYIMVK